jgi:hypothetical protein
VTFTATGQEYATFFEVFKLSSASTKGFAALPLLLKADAVGGPVSSDVSIYLYPADLSKPVEAMVMRVSAGTGGNASIPTQALFVAGTVLFTQGDPAFTDYSDAFEPMVKSGALNAIHDGQTIPIGTSTELHVVAGTALHLVLTPAGGQAPASVGIL